MSQPATQPRPISTREEMSPEYFETISKMLRSQAYRELAAAVVFAEALALVPTLEFKRHVVHTVEEEMEHYATCVRLAEQIGLEGFDEACTRRVRDDRPIPAIESFLELGVAACLYDSASAFQLREYENSSFDPYCRVIGRILEEEEGHENFGAELMIQLSRDPANRDELQRCFEKWLAVSLRSFGRPGMEHSRFAIEAGLKTRDSSAVAQDYIDALKSTLRVCGISLPAREQLLEMGTETAADIDLSVCPAYQWK
ncbi:MAG: Phenylacetic acid catabolic protein [Planctomycetota bacterium]|jgi:1,2-phenylacetyl-CoA epoxidase catalytic subunit